VLEFTPAGKFIEVYAWGIRNCVGEAINPTTGEYEDFLTGFTVGSGDGDVWGRPVGVAVAKDGSLFVSDDGSRSIWHVIYTGK
jgi:glucose/arabinose dehydrogenase